MRRNHTTRIGNRLDPYQVHWVSRRLRPWLHGQRPSIWAPSFIDNIKFNSFADSDGRPWIPSSAPIIENPLVAELNRDRET